MIYSKDHYITMQNIETLSVNDLDLFDRTCIEFVNDSDVYIGLTNSWPDWVTKSFAIDMPSDAIWMKLNEVLHPYIKYKTYNSFRLLLYNDELQMNMSLYVTISEKSGITYVTLELYE